MKFRVDFMSMSLPIRKARFKQFQELAFSKGIYWSSGTRRPYPVTRLRTMFHPAMVMFSNEFFLNGRLYQTNDKKVPIIDIKEAFKQLKEYKPSETTKIDKGTVQNTDATTASASYTISTSVTGSASQY